MAIRRGEVYDYTPIIPGRPRLSTKRLVITADQLNDPDLVLSVGLLVEDEDPGGLLSVRIGDQGWVSVVRIERLLPSRLGDLRYTATADELEQLAIAMRAAYDL